MTKPRIARPNFCVDCETDITTLFYSARLCKDCAKVRDNRRRQEVKDLISEQRRLNREKAMFQYRLGRAAFGLQYPGQGHSEDGKNYLVFFRGRWRRVKKVCQSCRADDATVKGQWGPIYSITDSAGNELTMVLLCLRCYDLECQGEQIAS